MATVIDSLLVTLGLDPQPYKKGAADAERSQKNLKENTKKAGAEMQTAIGNVARQIGLLVLGFASIKGAMSFLGDINNADAALGRLAANTGQNVHELKLWGNAVEIAGGDAKEAQQDVLNLSQAVTALRTTGDVSPLVLLAQRLGVAFDDADGKLKPMAQILGEMGDGLRQFDRRTAFNLGAGAGISQGTLNLLLQEEAARKRIMGMAERNNSIDDAAVDRATAMQERWRSLKQSAEDFGRVLLEKIEPGIHAFFNALEPIKPILVDIINKLTEGGAFQMAADAIVKIAEFAERAVDALLRLKGVATGEDEAAPAQQPDGSFVDASGRKLTGSAARHAARMEGERGFGSPDAKAAYERENAAYEASRQQRIARAAERNARAVPAGTGEASSTSVQIDSITINTQATDAAGIAAELPAALKRKGVIAQADVGMQ